MASQGSTVPPPKVAAPGERKGSQGGSGTLFAGLMSQKRMSVSESTAASARRQSFNDQKPAPGVIGQMWNNFTKGADK